MCSYQTIVVLLIVFNVQSTAFNVFVLSLSVLSTVFNVLSTAFNVFVFEVFVVGHMFRDNDLNLSLKTEAVGIV